MSRPDEFWIIATGVSHGIEKYADVASGSFGTTAKSGVTSKAAFSGDEISFAKAAVEAQASHDRGSQKHPNLDVEVRVSRFRLPVLEGTQSPLLSIKRVLAKLKSQDNLNFDKSGFKELRIFNHLVDINYKSSGEVRGGFLSLFKKPRFPFPFPNEVNGDQEEAREETIVQSLSWKNASSMQVLEAQGIGVEFPENSNRIEVSQSGERIAEIKLGVVRDLRPPPDENQPTLSNGRPFGRLTMCEIRTFPASNVAAAEVPNGGGGAAALTAQSDQLAAPIAAAQEDPDDDDNVTRVGDVRSDSVGTSN